MPPGCQGLLLVRILFTGQNKKRSGVSDPFFFNNYFSSLWTDVGTFKPDNVLTGENALP